MASIIEYEKNIKRLIQALHLEQIKNYLLEKHSIINLDPTDKKQKELISKYNIPISYKICRDYKFTKKSFKCISIYTLFIFEYNDEIDKYERLDAIEFKRIDELIIFLANRLNE